jgi:AraC-like DNA-binding protein
MARNPTHSHVVFRRDPDLPGFEVRYSRYGGYAFRKHTHAAYCVGVVESGESDFYLDGQILRTAPGDVVCINPGQVHACNPDPGSAMIYRMCYLAPHWIRRVGEELFGSGAGPYRFTCPLFRDADIAGAFEALFAAASRDASGAADVLEKESLVVSALGLLMSRFADAAPVGQEGGSQAAAAVRALLDADPAGCLSLDDLARAAGRGRFHTLRLFREAYGLPPHAYRTQLRVEMAKRLLAQGASIATTAQETGFSDQSHFTRVFREHTGATPNQYQTG